MIDYSIVGHSLYESCQLHQLGLLKASEKRLRRASFIRENDHLDPESLAVVEEPCCRRPCSLLARGPIAGAVAVAHANIEVNVRQVRMVTP